MKAIVQVKSLTCAAFAAVIFSASPALAVPTTYNFTFSATDFDHAVPVTPVTATVSVTFDPTADVLPTANDFSITGLNIAVDSQIQFRYWTVGDTLTIGGEAFGLNDAVPGTNDFYMNLVGFSTLAPTITHLYYIQGFVGGTSNSIAVDFAPSETPIPGALPLFASGIAGMAYVVHRRKRKQQSLIN